MKIEPIVVFAIGLIRNVLAMPQVVYAELGQSQQIPCNSNFFCYSSYTFKNYPHPMVTLNASLKYQISGGYLTITNVKETDAGFYTCTAACQQMQSDQIGYFLQPTSMGQPIDVSKSWVPIPPLPSMFASDADNLYVVVSDERLYAAKKSQLLSGGEIAGLVIGLVCALLLTIAVIVGLILLQVRRRRNRKEKSSSKRSERDTASIDYSTIERDYNGESATNTLTRDSNARLEEKRPSEQADTADMGHLRNIISEINTKDIDGPRSYRVENFKSITEMINQPELPNIDLNTGSGNAYQNQIFDNFKQDGKNAEPKNQYINQPLIQFPGNPRKPTNVPREQRLDSEPKMDNSNTNISTAGSVTVVSARTPAAREQRPSASSSQSARTNPNKQISFSQRVETTSTPFQLQIPPSQSFREVDYSIGTNYFNRDGTTDV